MTYIQSIPTMQDHLQQTDHFDVKTIDADMSLREFVAGFLSYYPWWIKALYGVRAIFVRFLGMTQEKFETTPQLTPEEVSFEAGGDGTIFTVLAGDENLYWLAGATDNHLTAKLVIAVKRLPNGLNQFYVGTIVNYHNWAGPVYFNVIRPFHHIVVRSMMANAVNRHHPQQPLAHDLQA